MRCRSCNYEPTMSEIQRGADNCSKCGASLSAVVSGKASRKVKRFGVLILMASVALAVLAGWHWNYERQERDRLFLQIEQKVRLVNGLAMELLDQSENLTRAQYFDKATRRTENIDSAIAEILAIDDSILPGVTHQAAEYGKSVRRLIKGISEYEKALVVLDVAEAAHRQYAPFANDAAFQTVLAWPDSLIKSKQNAELAAIESEIDLSTKIGLIKTASDNAKIYSLRINYSKTKRELEDAKSVSVASKERMRIAAGNVYKAGERLSMIAGHEFPVEKWELK